MHEVLSMPGVMGWIVCAGSCFVIPEPAGLIVCRHAADEAEVLTVGVAPARRKDGIGRALLEKAIDTLRSMRIRRLFLEVSELNSVAISLYKKTGFSEIGRRSRYYDNKTDALVLLYEIF